MINKVLCDTCIATCLLFLPPMKYPGSKQRRQRCNRCSGCMAKECGRCSACRDKVKFGGPGKLRQCCIDRKCVKIVSRWPITVPTKGSYGNTSAFNYMHMYYVADRKRNATTDIPSPKRWKSENSDLEPPSEGKCMYVANPNIFICF